MTRKEATRLFILAKLRNGDQIHPSEVACNQGTKYATVLDILHDLYRDGLAKRGAQYHDYNAHGTVQLFSIWVAGSQLDTTPVPSPVVTPEPATPATTGTTAKDRAMSNDDMLIDAIEPSKYDEWLAAEMMYTGRI